MCGITGLMALTKDRAPMVLRDAMHAMTDALHHRGPDDAGADVDEVEGLALGHRRLSIVDLSAAGHQPMASASGRYVIAFNGEIYNHLQLRAELEGAGLGAGTGSPHPGPLPVGEGARQWRGHSDTETLLAGFEHWGIETTLQRCVGMFAIALWDRQTRTLTLARDRMGEKPLYYGWVGRGEDRAFAFGSELKALRAYPGFANPVCRQALTQYLRFMYVPAPRSMYQGIYKLEPGCLLTVQGQPPVDAPEQPLRPGQAHGSLRVQRWWALADVVQAGARNPVTDDTQAVRLLEHRLSEAVAMQALADVPLGAFLSGGVDSSTIVALMQRQATRPVKTFTIGFDEAGFDEAPYALAVARHLGTDHHEMRVTAQMAQDVIPTLPWMYDEPFADASQIPTHLVCRAARQHVTVALSGDAGDELLGGYNRYFWGPRIWNRLGALPAPLRHGLGHAMASVPVAAWNSLGAPFMGSRGGVARLGDKLHKLADRLQTVHNLDGVYRSLVSEWADPAALVRGADGGAVQEPASLLDDPLPPTGLQDDPLPMMYRDSMSYLPDDILCKVDRAAMATSLETRVPFLDHRVVELAWCMPLHMKVRGNVGKWALRQVLYQHVPRELIERPKAGFAVPIGPWLRGPLRPWAEDLLSEARLRAEGYLHPTPIRQAWAEHLSGRRDHTARLWAVLMFQAWLQAQGPT
ncbi:asparagine synthase (glutamine-hydrolyzing) [Hydrogenophaga sp.]|uniref:asparagine synthase (glutamine-hydrolyzing) n=1 Tax=Hydrogenophaga sp. TaxID=1904254 RepID=UPI00391CC296